MRYEQSIAGRRDLVDEHSGDAGSHSRQSTVVVVAAYTIAVGALMAYAATSAGEEPAPLAVIAFLALQVVAGAALGRWGALLLVALPPLLAIPVPTPADAYEPLPLWFGLLIFTPLLVGLIGVGVATRKLGEQWPPRH